MKNWCRHKFGFVNVDDEFIYFTSTGNWSNTKDLGEFNEETTRKSSSSERYKTISYFAFVGIILSLVLWMVGFTNLTYTAIVGIFLLGYSAYHYMSPGLHSEFKIDHSNITKLEVKSSSVTITFLDFHEKETVQELIRLDQKGFDLFTELSTRLEVKTH